MICDKPDGSKGDFFPKCDFPNQFKLSDFEIHKFIGSGSFGRVYLGKDKESDLLVAIKIFEKHKILDNIGKQQIFYELYYHSKLKHPHITRMFTFFHDLTKLYIVLEYAKNGSLFDFMHQHKYNRLPENLSAKYIYQTADGLKYCHELEFFHGDIKPENILLDSHGNVKIADFGLAWPNDGTAFEYRGCHWGTKEYLAPELLNEEPFGEKIDHWALGVLCFELLVGRSAFACKRFSTTKQRILNVNLRFPKVVPLGAKDLISKLLKLDPEERLPLEDVMAHEWVREFRD